MSKVCRTCLKTIKGNYEILNFNSSNYILDSTLAYNKLLNCVPEMNLSLVCDAVICSECMNLLDVAYQFKQKCLQTEQDIRTYLETNFACTSENLLKLVQENKEQYEFLDNIVVKTEHSETAEVEQAIYESLHEYPINDNVEDHTGIKALIKMENPSQDDENYDSSMMCGTYIQEIDKQNLLNAKSSQFRYNFLPNVPVQENKFKCDMCSHSFNRRYALVDHKRTHVVKCSVCDFSTKNRNALAAHSRSHIERRYKCELCSYSTEKETSLIAHSFVHTGEKPFACTKCDRKFTSHISLAKHKNTHNIYRCTQCNYNSKNNYRIKLHMKTHTGERPFSCPKCDYRAGTKSTLQQHLKTHDNECHLCNFRTKTKLQLLDHLIYHAHKPNLGNPNKKEPVDDCSNKQKCFEGVTIGSNNRHADNEVKFNPNAETVKQEVVNDENSFRSHNIEFVSNLNDVKTEDNKKISAKNIKEKQISDEEIASFLPSNIQFVNENESRIEQNTSVENLSAAEKAKEVQVKHETVILNNVEFVGNSEGARKIENKEMVADNLNAAEEKK